MRKFREGDIVVWISGKQTRPGRVIGYDGDKVVHTGMGIASYPYDFDYESDLILESEFNRKCPTCGCTNYRP